MDRAPEAVAGMGVIVAEFGRTRRGGGADEDEAEVRAELVGEAVGGRFDRRRAISCLHIYAGQSLPSNWRGCVRSQFRNESTRVQSCHTVLYRRRRNARSHRTSQRHPARICKN